VEKGIFGKYIKRERGVNRYLFKLLEKFKNQFSLTYEQALYFVIKLYKDGKLKEEDQQLLEQWLTYQRVKMEEKIIDTINKVAKSKARSKNVKELIRNEYKRQKARGTDTLQILKFLKDYFLNEDYLKLHGYDKKEIKRLIVEVIKEEDKEFYLYLLEQARGGKDGKITDWKS